MFPLHFLNLLEYTNSVHTLALQPPISCPIWSISPLLLQPALLLPSFFPFPNGTIWHEYTVELHLSLLGNVAAWHIGKNIDLVLEDLILFLFTGLATQLSGLGAK